MKHTLTPGVTDMSGFTAEDNEYLKFYLDQIKITFMGKPNTTFITTILASVDHVWDLKRTHGTACTNGQTIFYCPYFMTSLTLEQAIAVMYHELWHVVFGHCLPNPRWEDFDKQKLNWAMDYVINFQAVNEGYNYMQEYKYDTKYDDDWHTELVYYDILKNGDPQSKQGNDFNDVIPFDPNGDGSDATPEQIKSYIDELNDTIIQGVIKADKYGDAPGSIPNSIRMRLQKLTNPKLTFKQFLKRYLTKRIPHDYTYTKRNRRNGSEVILPVQWSEGLGDIAGVMDLSASVDDAAVTQYVSQMTSILKDFKTDGINLLQFDTEITNITKVKTPQDLLINDYVGRGGTEITPVMKWANENNPELLIIFTDGGLWEPEIKPNCDVLWVVHDFPNFQMSFGKIIHFQMD